VGLFDKQTKQLDTATADLETTIAALKEQIADLKVERTAAATERDATKRIKNLQQQISQLEIDKAKIVEENAREKREVTHMVGLERKRQEFEAEQAKKGIEHAREQAILEVQKQNLDTERAAFVKEMAFREERFSQEVGYLKDLMGQILDRLPTVTVDRQISEKSTKTA